MPQRAVADFDHDPLSCRMSKWRFTTFPTPVGRAGLRDWLATAGMRVERDRLLNFGRHAKGFGTFEAYTNSTDFAACRKLEEDLILGHDATQLSFADLQQELVKQVCKFMQRALASKETKPKSSSARHDAGYGFC